MYLKLAIAIVLLSTATNAMSNCHKHNGVIDAHGNCDCGPFLTNLEHILKFNKPDYTEYCYKDAPLVYLVLKLFKKITFKNYFSTLFVVVSLEIYLLSSSL